MKRNIFSLFIFVTISIINFSVILFQPSFAEMKMVDGLKGSHNGVPVCHCPDDAENCICNIN